MAEVLKGCLTCGSRPKLSSISGHKTTYSYICCRISRKCDSDSEAAYYWNESNIKSDKTYRKNNKTNTWELINNESSKLQFED